MSETQMKVKSVHVANTPTGEYDPRLPLPYPYHIDADGNVLRQDFWKGEPLKLLGFQEGDVQRVIVFASEWLLGKVPDEKIVGMHPVFLDEGGGMWAHTFPVLK